LITRAVGCLGASTVSSGYNFAKVFAFGIQPQSIPRTESPYSSWSCCNGIGNARGSDFGRGNLSREALTDLSSTLMMVNFECVNGATPLVYHTLTAAIHYALNISLHPVIKTPTPSNHHCLRSIFSCLHEPNNVSRKT